MDEQNNNNFENQETEVNEFDNLSEAKTKKPLSNIAIIGIVVGAVVAVIALILILHSTFRMSVHSHNWRFETIKEATCTEKGIEKKTCDGCGEAHTYDTDYVDHIPVTKEGVSATCVTSGSTPGKKCGICSEILSGCEEIPPIPHSTGFGFCTKCGQLILELLPEANELADMIDVADNALQKVTDKANYALKLSASSIPNALNTAFSYVDPAESALIDAYTIASSHEEFYNLKNDIETMYGAVLYIQNLKANSSNFVSVAYDYIDAATIYWDAQESLVLKLKAYLA